MKKGNLMNKIAAAFILVFIISIGFCMRSRGFDVMVISGEISPDATGDYIIKGWYNNRNYYERKAGTYLLWWNGSNAWIINDQLGSGHEGWTRQYDDIEGEYYHTAGTSGTAIVNKLRLRRDRDF